MNKKIEFRNIYSRFKGLLGLGASDIISAVITSAFWLYITTIMDVESYGQLSYVIAIATISTSISLIGSKNTLTVCVSKNLKIESTIFFIVLIFTSVVSLITFLIFYDFELSLYVFGAVIFSMGGSMILGKKLFNTYSKYVIIQKSFWVGLSIGLYHLIGINGIVLGMGLSFFIYLPIVIKTFRTTSIHLSSFKPHFRFFMNGYMIDLLGTMVKQIDKLILLPLLGLTLLGNYHLALQFIAIFQLLPMIILKYTLPHDASGNPNRNLKILLVIVSGCLTVISILVTPIFIPIFFEKFIYVVEIIQILSLSLVPFSISTTYFSKFFNNKNSKILLINLILYLSSFLLIIFIISDTIDVVGVSIAYVIGSIISAGFLVTMDIIIKKSDKK
jgi:O-antigen/teichoic acid export membrane protein|tara:strand:- start:1205 stop:2368 length:1164 start_codon:yes stop_codon:yes gene_type:complete